MNLFSDEFCFSRRDRNSSDFSSEDDLPLSGFQKSDPKRQKEEFKEEFKSDSETKTENEEDQDQPRGSTQINLETGLGQPIHTKIKEEADMARKDDKRRNKIEDPEGNNHLTLRVELYQK